MRGPRERAASGIPSEGPPPPRRRRDRGRGPFAEGCSSQNPPQSVSSTFRTPALGLAAAGGGHAAARGLVSAPVRQGAPEPAFASRPGPRRARQPARPRASCSTRRRPQPEGGPLHPKGRLPAKAAPPSERPSLQLRPRSAATSPGHTPRGGHRRPGRGRSGRKIPRGPSGAPAARQRSVPLGPPR